MTSVNAMFQATDLNRRNARIQGLYRILFGLMTLLLITPVHDRAGDPDLQGRERHLLRVSLHLSHRWHARGWHPPGPAGDRLAGDGSAPASVPIGIFAAIYLSEYAGDNWFTRAINLAIINLAGVPSIVYALFGLGAFVIFFGFGTSILAASLTLAIMTMPVVIVATRESLQAVPRAFREACWNMGATRWQTIRRVVLPNAVTGILTGVILEVSRTAGETAPIMFTGAVFFTPFLPESVFDQTMALSLHLFVVSTQVPGIDENIPYAVALVLIGLVLVMNSLSIAFRMYLRGKKKW